jgi:hypothetical protein
MTALTLATFSVPHHALEEAFANQLRRFRLERKPVRQRYFGARLSAEARYSRQNGRLRSQMQSAVSHDAVPIDHPAEAYEPSPAKQRRVATTATLVAVAVCAILAKGHLLEAATPSHNAAVAQAQYAGTAPVTIVAPEFCKDQTWPYIDSRCLRRVDNPPPPADVRQAIAPRATTAAATSAPDSVSAKAVAAPPANSEAAASTSTPPAAPTPSSTDTRAQVIQSVFPTAESTATRDNDVQGGNANAATDVPAYQRTGDVSQHRRSRHWNNHSGFFGFRF